MTVEPVDDREGVRCDHCKLVQFATGNGKCRRCRKDCNAPEPAPAVEQVGNVDPTSSSGEGFAAQSAFPPVPTAIRKFREGLGLSQRQLAERMKVPRTYISKIENGKASPTIESLKRIAAALQITTADLVAGIQRTERDPFMREIVEAMPNLNKRNREYLVDAVRQLATTTERGASA